MIAVFAAFELMLMRFLPGNLHFGPTTPKGNVPVYKANGIPAFIITVATFSLCSFGLRLFPSTIIYDHFGELIGALNVLSLVFCLMLYIKGRYFPSSSDSGMTGNFLFDFYWGTELYPRILGLDIKMFTNCRFGMMSWGLIVLSFAGKQSELFGMSTGMIVAVTLQLVYVAKFFWWETGYLSSLDIMHDRAGFYICWGCMVWVPSVYTSATLFMVNHPLDMPPPAAMLLLLVGVMCIFTNYFADRQRQLVRETGGACLVWGKKPELLVAHFVTESGEAKQNLLLLSGFWGISRHFHYVPEFLAALCWSLPAGFAFGLPYFYVGFLAVLLTHRALRDDERCAKKYGRAWELYCERVPSKIIPGLF
jgi:7-dehydrocholesterol reductase